MEHLSFFLAFLPLYFVISITPGINMLSAMNIGSATGVRRAIPFILGAAIGVVFIASWALFAVVTMLSAIPAIFDFIRYAGAIFLCYIGIMLWRDSGTIPLANQSGNGVTAAVAGSFIKGFLTSLLNPKGWVFFAAFLPVFLTDRISLFSQAVMIVALVMLLETACMLVYALGGTFITQLVKMPAHRRRLNQVNAFVMFVLAAFLLLS